MAEAGPIDPDERVLALQRKAEDKGRQVLIDNNATVRRYFNSASALLKQGRQYHQDGKLEEAFLLFFRFACFFLERLPKHKDYNTPAMAASSPEGHTAAHCSAPEHSMKSDSHTGGQAPLRQPQQAAPPDTPASCAVQLGGGCEQL